MTEVESLERESLVSKKFCASEADLSLYSSDGVEFRVFSRILVEASPIFRDMMSLPRSADSQSTVNRANLEETEATLDILFQFLYPMPEPTVSTFEMLRGLMRASDKYILEGVMQSLRRILVSPAFVEREPLRAYALACMYRWEAEAKVASRHCLKIDILLQADHHEELAMMSARDLLRLIKLHHTRASGILAILDNSTLSPCQCSGPGDPPYWWKEFKARAKEEIRGRPMADVILLPGFLAAAVNAAVNGACGGGGGACRHCAFNYLTNATQARLIQIKGLIDALPDTV